jgi:hypothetical protein
MPLESFERSRLSSISSIGGSSLTQFLQGLSSSSQTSGVSATTPATTSSSTSATQGATAGVQGTGRRHRGHGFKQIQDAVTSALQTAQQSGSTTDPNQIVEDAISKVLQNSTSGTGTSATGTASAADPDGDGDPQSSTSGATSGTSGTQSFLQTLQSFGIDPQQFHQDFLSAVKDAQNGNSNAATAFQSFPVGSTVDTIG